MTVLVTYLYSKNKGICQLIEIFDTGYPHDGRADNAASGRLKSAFPPVISGNIRTTGKSIFKC